MMNWIIQKEWVAIYMPFYYYEVPKITVMMINKSITPNTVEHWFLIFKEL
jgi:hypothetical protein